MNGGNKSQAEQQGYGLASQDQQKTDQLTGQVNNNLSQFNGPTTSTPFYKSMLKTGTDSTNQAYDNASRNLKQQMQGAGVSGSSGAAVGNNTAVGASRAAALGQVPTQAVLNTVPLQMQANQDMLQEAGMYSGAGLGYFNNASQAEQQRLKNQGSLGQSAAQAAMMAAMMMM